MKIQKENRKVVRLHNILECEAYESIQKYYRMRGKSFNSVHFTNDMQNNGEDEIFDESLKCFCITSVLVNACYHLLCNYCNHVYIHRRQGKSVVQYPYRAIENYKNNEKYFSSDFNEEMFGSKDFSIKKLISDIENCTVVCVNEAYVKYQSNYASELFNTDTFGYRVVTNVPETYFGTIYLVGNCVYSGYAVADCDSVASILQEKLNDSNQKYRVVDISVRGSDIWNYMDKMQEIKFGVHDMIICWVDTIWNRRDSANVIITDTDNLIERLGENAFWDTVLHCGRKGYAILAEQIFKKIENDLVSLPERTFCMENVLEDEINSFITKLVNTAKIYQNVPVFSHEGEKIGAIVMNCNPFTYGHLYLIETSVRLVDILYVFVVEEDKSVFPFEDRFTMVQEGVKHFKNVIVLPSGKFMISSVTFPGYFLKENPDSRCYDSFFDLKIFAHRIAPVLGIQKRFVGEEPFDRVTAQYNFDMKTILSEQGIDVIEIPRKKVNDESISATKVRMLMKTGDIKQIKKYVPDSTIKYIQKIIRKAN